MQYKVKDGVVYKGKVGVIIDISGDLVRIYFEDGSTLWLHFSKISRIPEVDDDIEFDNQK